MLPSPSKSSTTQVPGWNTGRSRTGCRTPNRPPPSLRVKYQADGVSVRIPWKTVAEQVAPPVAASYQALWQVGQRLPGRRFEGGSDLRLDALEQKRGELPPGSPAIARSTPAAHVLDGHQRRPCGMLLVFQLGGPDEGAAGAKLSEVVEHEEAPAPTVGADLEPRSARREASSWAGQARSGVTPGASGSAWPP